MFLHEKREYNVFRELSRICDCIAKKATNRVLNRKTSSIRNLTQFRVTHVVWTGFLLTHLRNLLKANDIGSPLDQ